ncbi:MazG nucleotide pyrophosphohydrolase domain-containing protein [Bacillus carboniphilus]|uniref:MazG nucleotide pyrophosphohydrolase domain-containing protein n=1 Tax=Bacillus carboniphilus TaxID=86663 RepID=A0ABY9JS66_9BACI|nr:MazG nucleotide pyrophosphohydrolase domain-containing protein [Bacillus carboniphilus]WLR41654.1 MazG nucleotide pyrophosphohydrolase domain-containing protein [Bacillus carboniphilus]
MNITISELQTYIKNKDHQPDLKNAYFQKLIEEIGELSEALRKDKKMDKQGTIKGTIDEELYDCLYYLIALANVYDVDLQQSFNLKEQLNKEKYK